MPPVRSEQSEPALPAHTRVGRYEILGVLGRGGMGIVYRARDTKLGRLVALKCPFRALAEDETGRRRFLREARTGATLASPYIVAVHDVFESDARPWIASELIDGPTLREAITAAGGPLPVRDTLRTGEHVAEALRVAHAHRMLHRDIKPSNVLLSSDGRARLNDFGLAASWLPPGEEDSATTCSPALTSEGIVGTPAYMAPEQLLGRALDARCDLFAFGTLLYEMCTGVRAFRGTEKTSVQDAILNREPEAIHRLNYEVPEELARIVRKAMAKDPESRYHSAQDMVVDLRSLRRELESGTGSSATRAEPHRPSGGRGAWAAAAGVLAASVTLLIVWRPWEGDVRLEVGDPVRVTSSPAWEGEPALSPDGTRVAYTSAEGGNLDIFVVGVTGGQPLRLTNDAADDSDPTWFPDGSAIAFSSARRGARSIWKIDQLGGDARLIVPDSQDPAISPDGTRIAYVTVGKLGYERIGVAPLDDPETGRLITDDSTELWNHRHPAWSPDGERISYASRHNLWIVPSRGGRSLQVTGDLAYYGASAWSAGGEAVVFSSERAGTPALWWVSPEGGTPTRLTPGSAFESHPSISADGAHLAYATDIPGLDVVILDLESGGEARMSGAHADRMPSVTPDGTQVVFVSGRWSAGSDLWVQPLDGGRLSGDPQRLTDQADIASHPAVSPDGNWIAYYRIIDGRRDIWTLPITGGAPIRFTDHDADDIQPAWSPDGEQITFVSERSGQSQIWVAGFAGGERAGDPVQLTHRPSPALAPAWSPDGEEIAFISYETGQGEVALVAVHGDGPARAVTTGATARSLAWDPQTGALLVSGSWGTGPLTVKRVDPRTGETQELMHPVAFGPRAVHGDISLTGDGRFAAFTGTETAGDVWVLSMRVID